MIKRIIKYSIFMLTVLIGFGFLYLSPARAKDINNEAILYGEFDLDSEEITNVIVELNDKSIVESKHLGLKQTKELHQLKREIMIDILYDKLESVEVSYEYYYVFSGLALELPTNKIDELLKIPGIKAVYPNIQYTVTYNPELIEEFYPHMIASNPYVGTPNVWDMGYTGEGMTIAVIDSGVDYTHPELMHAFDDYLGYDFYDMDDDPFDERGHGTHVAGTIAARSFGIAPDARLIAYRVLGPQGTGTTMQVLAGIEQAVIDGVDVMNLSLGNSINDPDYATSIALDWAMAEGVVAVTSSGNEGPYDWTVGSPGASREAITVGSTALPTVNFHELSLHTKDGYNYDSFKIMGYNDLDSLKALDGKEYEFVFVQYGYKEEFNSVDALGKVAVIMRGEITFAEKVENAKNAGAIAVIIINYENADINASGNFVLPTFQMHFDDGYHLFEQLIYGLNNKLTINVDFTYIDERISDFSSTGPAYGTWMIKPDVVAPGDWILSTYPGGYYAYAGGTSMASPHVAAASALILQAHPNYTPFDVKAALMNTAERIIDPLTGEEYPHNVQGAGSIRIDKAIKTQTLVTPGSYSFGVFNKQNGKEVKGIEIEIKNLSNTRIKYSFNVEFYGDPQGIKIMHSNNTNVKAKGTQNIQLNVQVDAKKALPGKYEGMITVSDGKEEIYVPLIFFVGEPDYPRVSFAGVQDNYDGTYLVYAYLLGGAEYVEISFFTFDYENYAIGYYIDTPFYAYNVPSGFYIELWDGTVLGNIKLPPGIYVIYTYAEYKGKASAYATLFEIR